jgi:response regulator RpfG family c-di-GMP phosphodiesterase
VRCIELGAEDYLSKPVNPVLLKARIDASLEKKRLRDQHEGDGAPLRHAEVAQDMQQSASRWAASASMRRVMFSDIRDFTPLAESQPPRRRSNCSTPTTPDVRRDQQPRRDRHQMIGDG